MAARKQRPKLDRKANPRRMPTTRMDEDRDALKSAFAAYVPPKAKVGRPSTYDPAIADRVLELAANGHNLGAIAAAVGVLPATLKEWAASFPDFASVLTRAQGARQLFYEGHLIDIVRRGGDSTRFNAVRLGLINVAPEEWKEKLTGDVNVTLSLAQLIQDSMKTIEGEKVAMIDASPAKPRDDGSIE